MTANGGAYDCIIVGGGHNGLVAAFDLAQRRPAGRRARAPRRRRRRVRHGGVRARLPRVARRLRPEHAARLDLARPAPRAARRPRRRRRPEPAPLRRRCRAAPARRRSSARQRRCAASRRRDAKALVRLQDDLAVLAEAIAPMFDWTPPNLGDPSRRDAGVLAKLALRGGRYRAAAADLAYIFSTSASQYLAERFESEHVRASLGWHAINDSTAGPATPGTAFVLLHDHAAEEAGGGIRSWGFVRGGMGQVTRAMSEAAQEAGAEVRTGAEVARILVADGSVEGVELADGTVLRSALRRLERRSQADVPRAARCRRAARRVRGRHPRLPLRGREHEDQPRALRAAPRALRPRQRRRALPPRADPAHGAARPPRSRPGRRAARRAGARAPHRALHPDACTTRRSRRTAGTC